MSSAIVLDFDGVVCDGVEECLLIAWNSFHGKNVEAFGLEGLAEIPRPFIDVFAYCRNFVRHSGHFLVPFLHPDGGRITSQAEFDKAYGALLEAQVSSFLASFDQYREQLRAKKIKEWLNLQTLYGGMPDAFRNCHKPIYIVTGKDRPSVLAILKNARIELPEDRVYGSQTNKIPALQDIACREAIQPEKLHFFDDNVPNVIDANKAGVTATWATWGYKTPEHVRLAAEAKLRSIALPEFLEWMSKWAPSPAA